MRRSILTATLVAIYLAGSVSITAPTADAAFPGMAGRIVFHRLVQGHGDIFTIKPDGSGLRRLTDNGTVNDFDPAWSHDGKQVVFVRTEHDREHVFVMDSDGSHVRRVTSGKGADRNPTWSPDGTRIAFDRVLPGTHNVELFIVEADGSNLTRFTHRHGIDSDPSWSPDGLTIAYSRADPGEQVWTKPVAVGAGSPLITDTASDPDWSPDGQRIAYVGPGGDQEDIWVADADGTNAEEIGTMTEYGGFAPAWSPEGNRIAFSLGCAHGGCGGIDIVKADGTGLVHLTSGYAPSWRPVS
ncbi:MAG: hypothetical protein ABR600_02380 [Actinomycetota bacterium]